MTKNSLLRFRGGSYKSNAKGVLHKDNTEFLLDNKGLKVTPRIKVYIKFLKI